MGAKGSGQGGHTIQDEGSDLTKRKKLNFVGAGVTVTDDSGNDASKVTITSGGGGEANTSSNDGLGEGVAKAKDLVDLPFKSLLGTANEIVLVGNVNDVTFSLSALVARLATKLDDFGTPDDNTDLDATTILHGLFAKLDKVKLDAIESSATADQSDAEIKTAYENNADTNEFSDAEQTKLSGIAALAEVNPDLISQAEAEAGVATTERIFSALRVKQAIDALGGGGGGTKTISFPIVEMIPEGTIGTPDIHAFATAGMKQDGWFMPDGASDSKINLRGYLPPTLAATPNMKIIVMIITLGAVASDKAVHIAIDGKYRGNAEDVDVAQTDVALTANITLPVTTEALTIHTFDPSTDPAGNDVITFTATRKPANAGDTFTNDILIFVKGVVDV